MGMARSSLILGLFLCVSGTIPAYAQFKLSPADSARMAKAAIAREDSIKRAAAETKARPATKDTLSGKGSATKVDSSAASHPAPPSNTRTIERSTAPQAGKNLPRVKDANPKTR
jgi:hypothetical protein